MRADIHGGPEHPLQSEAGYIDARPHSPVRGILLRRTAGPYIWVITGHLAAFNGCLLYPRGLLRWAGLCPRPDLADALGRASRRHNCKELMGLICSLDGPLFARPTNASADWGGPRERPRTISV